LILFFLRWSINSTQFNQLQEAIHCALTALCNEEDEILIVEPSFDCYAKSASEGKNNFCIPNFFLCFCHLFLSHNQPTKSLAGLLGIGIRTVSLEPRTSSGKFRSATDWVLDMSKLNAAITPRTRILILNTPSSPVGKAFSHEELQAIADVVQRHP
jgi:aspartate/methionine/tyrosine aminotransferase